MSEERRVKAEESWLNHHEIKRVDIANAAGPISETLRFVRPILAYVQRQDFKEKGL
jgi:hypothetical protein